MWDPYESQIFSIFIAERFIVLLMQLMKFQFLSVFKTFPGKFWGVKIYFEYILRVSYFVMDLGPYWYDLCKFRVKSVYFWTVYGRLFLIWSNSNSLLLALIMPFSRNIWLFS